AGRDGQRAVDAVGAAVGADHIALAARERAAHDRPALAGIGAAPTDRQRTVPALDRMRGEADMFRRVMVSGHACTPSTPLPSRGAFFAERQYALLTVLGFERLDQRRQPLRLRFAGRQMGCSSYDLLDRAHRQRRTREN